MCFDGAAMSGYVNRVQAKFKEKNERSFFVHCYGQRLNLILVDSVGWDNRITFDFFGNIQLNYTFIEGRCTKHGILENISKTEKSVSTIRRADAVSWC
jgi:hypothetical protein